MTATMDRMVDPHTTSIQSSPNTVDGVNAAASEQAGSSSLRSMLDRMRTAQVAWQQSHYTQRLKCIARIAGLLAEDGPGIAHSVQRPAATDGEILASEVLPLAEACRYVARRGADILRTRTLRQRDGAWWMGSIRVIELRDPLGIVLIIGPSNYPLYLPGVQLIQALATGNAVLVKPAPGCEEAVQSLAELCIQAGVPANLINVLDSDPSTAQQVIAAGVDKVLFTGSLNTGRQVFALCAQHMTPAAMELSGNDAVLVADDADLARVAQCVAYGLSLNGGQTCIAPRRLFATAKTLERLIPLLSERLSASAPRSISERGLQVARRLVEEATSAGARIVIGNPQNFADATSVRPLVLSHVTSTMPIAAEDIFAPLLSLISVDNMHDAVRQAAHCPYALGAAVFGQSDVVFLAKRLSTGCVTVNDILVPTADPRVSFGGRKASGFGLTRGLEGLRELTQLKVVCERQGRWLPHLTTTESQLGSMLNGILKLRHGRTWSQRWSGIKSLMKVGKQK